MNAPLESSANAPLEIERLSVRRGTRDILRGVSFSVASRRLVALMGLSGSGKSTLLRSVAALEPFDGGATAKETAPGLDVQVRVEVNTAARLLEQESETAALIVVGSRGTGGFSGLLLGSVAIAIAGCSRCPVVIVRGEEPAPGDPVVVGVHGAPANWLVVDRAFEEAAVRGTSLVAVHAWTPPLESEELAASAGIRWSELETGRQSLVAQRLSACADRHAGVPVETHVVQGSPAQRLVEFAEHAALLVVGSHGDDSPGGVGMGSTSQAVVQYAPCPVLLMRPGLAEQMDRA